MRQNNTAVVITTAKSQGSEVAEKERIQCHFAEMFAISDRFKSDYQIRQSGQRERQYDATERHKKRRGSEEIGRKEEK